MTVMVGGTSDALDIARPVFNSFARLVAHLGPVGSGQLIKLLNNNLAYANVVASIDALELAEQLGMDREVAIEVIKLSSGASNGPAILADPRTFRKISGPGSNRSEEHTSELQSLMRISYAVFCLKKKKITAKTQHTHTQQLYYAEDKPTNQTKIGNT